MHPSDRVFQRRLEHKVIEEQDKRVGQLAAGAAKDYADYRNWCGYVQALEHVRAWCQEIAESDEPARPQ